MFNTVRVGAQARTGRDPIAEMFALAGAAGSRTAAAAVGIHGCVGVDLAWALFQIFMGRWCSACRGGQLHPCSQRVLDLMCLKRGHLMLKLAHGN